MDYLICIFLLGVIVTFIVIVGLARAAEFAKAESAQRFEIDGIPKDWDATPSDARRRAPFKPAILRQDAPPFEGRL